MIDIVICGQNYMTGMKNKLEFIYLNRWNAMNIYLLYSIYGVVIRKRM